MPASSSVELHTDLLLNTSAKVSGSRVPHTTTILSQVFGNSFSHPRSWVRVATQILPPAAHSQGSQDGSLFSWGRGIAHKVTTPQHYLLWAQHPTFLTPSPGSLQNIGQLLETIQQHLLEGVTPPCSSCRAAPPGGQDLIRQKLLSKGGSDPAPEHAWTIGRCV